MMVSNEGPMIVVSSEVEHQILDLAVTGSTPVPPAGCKPARQALNARTVKLEDGERYDRSAAVWQLRSPEVCGMLANWLASAIPRLFESVGQWQR